MPGRSESRSRQFEPEPHTLLLEDRSLAGGFVQLPKRVLYARNLSRDAKLLYAVLLGHAWQDDRCFPGYRRLCADLNASENMVRKYMRELERTGLLRQKRRGLGKTNLYLLCDLRTADLAAPERQELRYRARTAESAVPEPSRNAVAEPCEIAAPEPPKGADNEEAVEQEREWEEAGPLESPAPRRTDTLADDERSLSILRRVITDFACEFNDLAHERSNVTRAVNLWRRSGLPVDDFVTYAYDARRLTREYQGKQPPGKRIEAKGAYFFAVLEDIVARVAGQPKAPTDRAPPATRHRQFEPPRSARGER